MQDRMADWAPEIGVEDLFAALGRIRRDPDQAARPAPDCPPVPPVSELSWWAALRRRAASGLHSRRAACGSVVASRGQSQAKRPT